MPTEAELERLEALLERLEPLAAKERGELIRSAEWNDLVGAVGDLTRAVLGEDRTTVVPPHEHSEQVALGWLSPALRRLLTDGPLSDAGAIGRLGRSERELGRLGARLDDLAADVDGHRSRVTEVATNDLAREATLTDFGRRLSGIGDARDEVADVRRTLGTVQTDVQRAIEVGQRLQVNGEPLDVQGLLTRVGELERLRTRLTLPDGQLLDATEFQRQIGQLETRLVTEEELDVAIGTVRNTELPTDVLDLLATRAADAAGERLGGRLTQVQEDLRAEVASRFGEVDTLVTAAIAGATPSITATVIARAESLVRGAVAETDAAVRAALRAELDARVQRLAATVGEQIDDLRRQIPRRVTDSVTEHLPGLLAPVDERVSALAGRIEANEVLVAGVDARSRAVETRVEQVNREDTAARAAMLTELRRRIDEVSTRIDPRVREAVTEARAGVTADLRIEIAAMRSSIETGLAATAAEVARTELRLLQGRLDTNIRAVVQDELVATRRELLTEIDGRLADNDIRLNGLVATEVRRATSDMNTLIRHEIESRVDGLRPAPPE
jgi:hypothetical protein